MENRIKVLLIPAFRDEPEVYEIENKLEEFQRLVGGYIEVVSYGDLIVICDEEGRIKGKPVNRNVPEFVGDILICGTCGEEFCSIDENAIALIRELVNGGDFQQALNHIKTR